MGPLEILTLNNTSTLIRTMSKMKRGKPARTYYEAPVSYQLAVSEGRRSGCSQDVPNDMV